MDEPAFLRNSRILPYVLLCVFFGMAVLLSLPQDTISERAKKNVCINNLRLIDRAKQKWGLEHQKTNSDMPTWMDILHYVGPPGNTNILKCPSGGMYTLGAMTSAPTCSIPCHALP